MAGGYVKFHPNNKRGRGGKGFSHAKGGRTQNVSTLQKGRKNSLPCLEGEGVKSFRPAIFPFSRPTSL